MIKQLTGNKRNLFCVLCLLIATTGKAQNPIVPPGLYIADPSAHQWKDGKMYIYGSKDTDPEKYCSTSYDVLSSSDLTKWSIHSNTFSSTGSNDQVAYSDMELYAPDCIEKDGKYYLYYCLSQGPGDEGVAVSDSPIGPFLNGEAIEGMGGIDPAVFIDDDGQAYITWGQVNLRMAKLNPDMKSIDLSSVKNRVITEAKHYFHEGSQLFKRNGIYYLVYADISQRGRPTSIGYSTSNHLFGPYTYQGVIVDNFGSDPHVWNNHGYVAPFNDEWYVFYHRATHGSVTMRKACIEPIKFNPDGTIPQVEMTTQGVGAPLNPFEETDAARACYLTGNVRIALTGKAKEELVKIQSGNTAVYKYLNFDQSPKKLQMDVTPIHGGEIQVFINNFTHLIATIQVPEGDGKTPITLTTDLLSKRIKGIHPVYFRFNGNDDIFLFNVDSFIFL